MGKFFAWVVRYKITILATIGILPGLAVAAVTGNASWGHIVHVGREVGEPSAAWLPVAVDGMMLTGALFAWVDTLRGYRPRGWSYVTLILGSLMTLTFNVVSAVSRGLPAMIVAAIYAVTFLATVETILHPSKRLRKAMAAERAAVAIEAVPAEVSPATPVEPESPAPVAEAAPEVTTPEAEPRKPAQRRPRRGAGVKGYPGPSDVEVDAALEQIRERAAANGAAPRESASEPAIS